MPDAVALAPGMEEEENVATVALAPREDEKALAAPEEVKPFFS